MVSRSTTIDVGGLQQQIIKLKEFIILYPQTLLHFFNWHLKLQYVSITVLSFQFNRTKHKPADIDKSSPNTHLSPNLLLSILSNVLALIVDCLYHFSIFIQHRLSPFGTVM